MLFFSLGHFPWTQLFTYIGPSSFNQQLPISIRQMRIEYTWFGFVKRQRKSKRWTNARLKVFRQGKCTAALIETTVALTFQKITTDSRDLSYKTFSSSWSYTLVNFTVKTRSAYLFHTSLDDQIKLWKCSQLDFYLRLQCRLLEGLISCAANAGEPSVAAFIEMMGSSGNCTWFRHETYGSKKLAVRSRCGHSSPPGLRGKMQLQGSLKRKFQRLWEKDLADRGKKSNIWKPEAGHQYGVGAKTLKDLAEDTCNLKNSAKN